VVIRGFGTKLTAETLIARLEVIESGRMTVTHLSSSCKGKLRDIGKQLLLRGGVFPFAAAETSVVRPLYARSCSPLLSLPARSVASHLASVDGAAHSWQSQKKKCSLLVAFSLILVPHHHHLAIPLPLEAFHRNLFVGSIHTQSSKEYGLVYNRH
jgi:hypothetical protein